MIEEILAQAAAEGVCLALTPEGGIEIMGSEERVASWLPILRDHKEAILERIREGNHANNYPRTRQASKAADPAHLCLPVHDRNSIVTQATPTCRQTHCPAFPRSRSVIAGAPWTWCQVARGKMAACSSCPWGLGLPPSSQASAKSTQQ